MGLSLHSNGTRPELKAAGDYCRWLTKLSGSHFVSSFILLSPERRRAMEAVYAYCRAVDDVADRQGLSADEARHELNLWRNELSLLTHGHPTHPIALAAQNVVRRYAVPVEFFEKLIRGVEMDLVPRRYQTFSELQTYCEHVASIVGQICVRVFGCKHPAADRYALHLGVALQLTNILRDLPADFEQGRLYLPMEDLKRFGLTEAELASKRPPAEKFKQLMRFQAQRAKEHFQAAAEALKESGEAKKLLPARMMGGVYRSLLSRIEASAFDVYSKRISVPRVEQLQIALKCMLPFALSLSKGER